MTETQWDGSMENRREPRRNLKRAELAAIYRVLRPEVTYFGDPPEKWTTDVLINQIRHAIGE